jgi:phosphoserine phosphatase RsbU/P
MSMSALKPTAATSPLRLTPLDDLLPGPRLPHAEEIRQLEEQIAMLTTELTALRIRDESVNGMMQRLDEEQRLAARLQRDFLPKKLPQCGTVHFHTLFRPAGYVSGDLYDVMRLDETHIGFYIADAVGHGMPAALLTMFMKNALVTKSISSGTYSLLEPAHTISKLNHALCEQNLSHATFATAAYGYVDTRTLQMSFSTGGHPHPVLIRDRKLVDLTNDGALLGIFAEETFTTQTLQLQRGDRVLIYTDGIEVAFSENDQPDTEEWRKELVKHIDHPVSTTLDSFTTALDEASGSLLPKDDLTIIAIEVK